MLYRKFGKTNVDVSQLGFGCMRFPLLSDNPSDIDTARATKMLHYAIDNGLNYIDTAFPYHGKSFSSPNGGASEPFIGKALADGYRDKINVVTKLPCWVTHSRKDMDDLLNLQLKRLKTDYIDFYLVHALNKHTWAKMLEYDLPDFLDCAVKDGRVKHVGFSFHDDLATFKKIVDARAWEFCMIQYNYIDQNFQAGEHGLQYAYDKGLGIAVMEPLRGGALVEMLPEEVKKEFEESNFSRTPAEWALRWLYNDERISVVLSGMSNIEQVKQNISVASNAKANAFSQDEIQLIKRVQNKFLNRIKVNCTSCGYCLPCPFGVNIPRVFQIYNSYFLLDDSAKDAAISQYNRFLSNSNNAFACTRCTKCLEKCPQQIPIDKHMIEINKLMKT